MYMKAWTLFLVILFPNIYEQRHTSAYSFTDNRSLHWHATSIVRDTDDIIQTVLKIVKEKYPVFNLSENKFYCEANLCVRTLAIKTTFNTIKNKTHYNNRPTRNGNTCETTNKNTNLLNNSELESLILKGSLENMYDLLFGVSHPPILKELLKKLLLKPNLYE